jgi:K(+)-stimulated pyrophosphate-energized sodium pump
MNPIIKFTTLFGLLALELALGLAKKEALNAVLAVVLFCIAVIFVVKSFTDMRAKEE